MRTSSALTHGGDNPCLYPNSDTKVSIFCCKKTTLSLLDSLDSGFDLSWLFPLHRCTAQFICGLPELHGCNTYPVWPGFILIWGFPIPAMSDIQWSVTFEIPGMLWIHQDRVKPLHMHPWRHLGVQVCHHYYQATLLVRLFDVVLCPSNI